MSKKYTSPEHAIRNIMKESGASTFKNLNKLGTTVKDKMDDLFDLFPSTTSKGEVVPSSPNANLPAAKPETTPQAPAKTEVTPQAPAKTELETKPKSEVDTKTVTKPKSEVDTKTVTKPKSEVDTKTSTKTDLTVKPRTDVATQSKPAVRSPEPPPPRSSSSNFRNPRFPAFGLTPGQEVGLSSAGVFGVRDYLHRPDAPAPYLGAAIHTEETADEIRRKIENVARPNSDRNKVMARNESIKKKIIDENAKKKAIIKDAINDKYSKSVEISPEIKSDKLTEKSLQEKYGVKRAAAGASAGLIGGQAVNQAAVNAYDQPPKQGGISDTALDIGLDVASMIPVVGAVPSAINAYRNYQKGDYLNAALDAAGVVPGVKWLTTPLKWGGKAIKGADIGTKIAKTADLGTGVIPKVADQVAGGIKVPTTGILAGTKTGNVIDKSADAFERTVATPGNLFQLGTGADALQQGITGKSASEIAGEGLKSAKDAILTPEKNSEPDAKKKKLPEPAPTLPVK